LQSQYIIERTPQRTHLLAFIQGINLDEAKPFDSLQESYFQGNTVIELHRDYVSGQITSVDIAQCDGEGLGMGSLLGSIRPEWLAIYGGVSPFRLYGHKPEDWRIVSVSPEEWVFELAHQPEEGSTKTRFHLDRRYQDALSRLEVRYPNGGVHIWRVLKYKRIEGIWFPSEVEYIAQGGAQEVRSQAILVRYKRTKAVEFRIPDKTPVRDWRRLGSKAWEKTAGYEETEWSESLLKPSSTPVDQRSKEPSGAPKRR